MPVHLRALISFAAVAEEGSFTRAAERMGLTQPWVSEQVRNLEEYLGFPLFIRSTRKLGLTAEGTVLLGYAQRLTAIRDEAEDWVRSMKTSVQSRIRIGHHSHTANVAQRANLVDRFIARYERVEVEFEEDTAPNLMDGLRNRELDMLILFDRNSIDRQEFDVLSLAEFQSYLLVPPNDPVALLERIPTSALAGRHIVTTPAKVDPSLVESLEQSLGDKGVKLVSAPESNRSAVERFAMTKGYSVFRWREPGQGRKYLKGMVQLPLEDSMTVSLVLVRNKDLASRNVERFWRMAAEMAAEPFVAHPDAAPAQPESSAAFIGNPYK